MGNVIFLMVVGFDVGFGGAIIDGFETGSSIVGVGNSGVAELFVENLIFSVGWDIGGLCWGNICCGKA